MKIVRPDHPPFSAFAKDFRAILQSGEVTNNGRYVQEFEKALEWIFDAPVAVFNNGQSALMALLAASDIKGKDVIVPSFTFCATPHAVMWAGGNPIFVDIDPFTLCLDPVWVAGTPASAILAVDPYGLQCDVSAMQANGVPVFIDSAPSFGSYPDKTRGDAQIFSFHATKPFSTMEGGALVTKDLDLLERAKKIRNFGQDAAGECAEPGFNGKMMEVCALMGLHQLRTWMDRAARRKSNAADLGEMLMHIPGIAVVSAPAGQAPIWLYRPILVDESEFGMSRDGLVAELAKREIYARIYYRPCHLMQCYKWSGVRLPVTERIASQVIALPVYNDFRQAEMQFIADAISSIYQEGPTC